LYKIEIKVNDNLSKQTVDPTATFALPWSKLLPGPPEVVGECSESSGLSSRCRWLLPWLDRLVGNMGATSGAISGYVRDGSGAPQMGAAVEILGSAAQALKVFTDDRGFYSVASLVPGTYSVKVSAPSFCLPCATKSASARAQS
jgi:hypothetical protein